MHPPLLFELEFLTVVVVLIVCSMTVSLIDYALANL
jgi:preprotein translocase subunit SecE